MLYQIIEQPYANARYNAGSKARTDAVTVLTELGFIPVTMAPHDESRATAGKAGKLLGHVKAARDWKKALKAMGGGDIVLLQLPLINHTMYIDRAFAAAKKRGLKVIALLHDLEELRCQLGTGTEAEKARYAREGRAQRQLADIIIAHNESMKRYLMEELGVPEQQIVVLGIFDYLLGSEVPMADFDPDGIIIAGNLSPEKTGYIYKLPEGASFYLYGKGLDEERLAGCNACTAYKGVFSPDAPALSGAYGLVWDGDSPDTCGGIYGAYVQYNAPHKTSLYLACGLPVIIWKQAGLAPLIEQEGLGLTVGSLGQVPAAAGQVSIEEYAAMRTRAEAFAGKLRNGLQLKNALNEALDRLGDIYGN